ncbi:hypothetical protein KM043_012472 [Ampulex compressa]|nr:hypothetical protein KM043_012472 [Ampulex compressa]
MERSERKGMRKDLTPIFGREFLCGAGADCRVGRQSSLAESAGPEVHPGSHPAALRSLFRERYEVSRDSGLIFEQRGAQKFSKEVTSYSDSRRAFFFPVLAALSSRHYNPTAYNFPLGERQEYRGFLDVATIAWLLLRE